jgi:aspartate-semialdehyde dehydrogenase
VRVVSLTGSARVGALVARTAAEADIKKMRWGAAGNAPFIVTADADLDVAVKVALGASTRLCVIHHTGDIG